MYRFIILTLFLSACATTKVPIECALTKGGNGQLGTISRHADVTTTQQNGIKSSTIVIK